MTPLSPPPSPPPSPVPDPDRRDYGFTATGCGCTVCTNWCRVMPGFLSPADLPRLAGSTDIGAVVNWAVENLLASPGALLGRPNLQTGQLETFRVATLVPARTPPTAVSRFGECKFLTTEGRCSVHAAAPFGCRFNDCRTTTERGHQMSLVVLRDIAVGTSKWARLYRGLVGLLGEFGSFAPDPKDCRPLHPQNPDGNPTT